MAKLARTLLFLCTLQILLTGMLAFLLRDRLSTSEAPARVPVTSAASAPPAARIQPPSSLAVPGGVQGPALPKAP